MVQGAFVGRFVLTIGVLGGATAAARPARAQQVAETPVVRTDAPPASANDAIARGLFQAGKAAFDAGAYSEALTRFQEAYDHSQKPELLYNIGLAADRLRYNQAALQAFEKYQRLLPDAENRVEVENRIRALHEVIDREAAAGKTSGIVGVSPVAAASVDTRVSGTRPSAARESARSDPGLVSKWWFWTAVGVVAAGVVTAIAVASSGDTVGKPVPGSGGVVVATLRVR
jgi:hypothetical protein